MLYLITFILAFCSIVYELLLGQALSAFLGNTVLRYSVTIGLYMLSMGIGALFVRERIRRNSIVALQMVEVLLTIIGGTSILLLFGLDALNVEGWFFSLCAHSLIIVIGILTGIELPLLLSLKSDEHSDTEGSVLSVDYLGAFFGTIVFAFYFYPAVGLIPASLSVAIMNAFAGMLLFTQVRRAGVFGSEKKAYFRLLSLQAFLLLALLVGLNNSSFLTEEALAFYLQREAF